MPGRARDRADRAAAMRAWYLPWWVSSARWLASPTAYSQPSATSRTRQVSSTSSHNPGVKPTVCSPMSSVSGARPVANNTSSTSNSLPSSSSTATGPVPPGLRSLATETPIRTSTPASESPRPTRSPTNGSIRGSRPERRASSVTCCAQTPPGGGHFDGDAATADDCQPVGNGAAVGGAAVRPRPGLGDAGHVGQRGAAADAHRDRVSSGQLHDLAVRCRDGNAARPVEPGVAADEFGTGGLDPVRLAGVVEVRHVPVPAAEDAVGVD